MHRVHGVIMGTLAAVMLIEVCLLASMRERIAMTPLTERAAICGGNPCNLLPARAMEQHR